ncbi:MAG: hypothetical protein LBT73_01465, partial [Tannerellaceae bacterium]|nr:hypothetical protein [Tannerellaceae bacterium]
MKRFALFLTCLSLLCPALCIAEDDSYSVSYTPYGLPYDIPPTGGFSGKTEPPTPIIVGKEFTLEVRFLRNGVPEPFPEDIADISFIVEEPYFRNVRWVWTPNRTILYTAKYAVMRHPNLTPYLGVHMR